MHGELAPGESSPIYYSFYGHSDIVADVVAACKVDGGPTYELQLRGEASRIHYCFSNKALEFGAVQYDQVHSTEIVLFNRGRVTFDFTTLNVKTNDSKLAPGDIAVSPTRGEISANESVTFTVTFLPGIPETFKKSFEIEVAHFEADVITLTGKAIYPTITMKLPRDMSGVLPQLQEEAKANIMEAEVSKEGTEYSADSAVTEQPSTESLGMEIDRLLVKKFVTESIERLSAIKHKPRYIDTSLFNLAL